MAVRILMYISVVTTLHCIQARPQTEDQEQQSASYQETEAHQLAVELEVEESQQCDVLQDFDCALDHDNTDGNNQQKDSSVKVKPQGIYGFYDYRKVTPEQIESQTNDLISTQRVRYEVVGKLPMNEVNFDNVIQTLADLETERSTHGSPLEFAQRVALDKHLRNSSANARRKLVEFDVEMGMRKDIFDRVVSFNDEIGLDNLNDEQKRLVEKLILYGKRNGLNLSEDIQYQVKEIKKRLSELSINYQRNLNEDDTKLYFTALELAGMSDDFINALVPNFEGKLEVTLKYPHLFPIIMQCRVPETRRQMVTADLSLCMEENTPLLEELIQLRQEKAELLGYKNEATYILEERMARKPEAVNKFLSDLSNKLQTLWTQEHGDMLKLKKKECEKYGYEYSGKIDYWDYRYYMNKIKENVYAVDQNEIKQYFPLEKVTSGLLQIYQLLLGLNFTHEPDAQTWHDDVKLYRVNDITSNELLGYFFLDLFPREGKYAHAAVVPLQPSCVATNGVRQVAVCAMICNFATPSKDKPALLDHSEVETYFHEFGHVMHNICSQTTSSIFAGTRVERDFVEAPSQMFENWIWEKEPLKLMSGHYQNGSTLPDEMVEKLQKSHNANAGGLNLRQIVLASFDQAIHTQGSADTKTLFSKIWEDVMGIESIPNTNLPANFMHLAAGYHAQYYGYLWSEVFSMDMYASRFEKEGVMNPAVGKEFRSKILQPGGSKDAAVLLQSFLGRDPNSDAFLISKGLSS